MTRLRRRHDSVADRSRQPAGFDAPTVNQSVVGTVPNGTVLPHGNVHSGSGRRRCEARCGVSTHFPRSSREFRPDCQLKRRGDCPQWQGSFARRSVADFGPPLDESPGRDCPALRTRAASRIEAQNVQPLSEPTTQFRPLRARASGQVSTAAGWGLSPTVRIFRRSSRPRLGAVTNGADRMFHVEQRRPCRVGPAPANVPRGTFAAATVSAASSESQAGCEGSRPAGASPPRRAAG